MYSAFNIFWIVYTIFFLFILILSTFWYNERRSTFPLNARNYYLVLTSQLWMIVHQIILLLMVGFGWYISEPFGQEVHIIFVFLSLPLYHHTYLWRGYQLYVLYNLTEYRFNKEGAQNNEEMNEVNSNWLVKRTQSVSQTNLWKSYLRVNLPIVVIFPIIGALLDIKIGEKAFIPIAIISVVYSIVLALLTILLRKVQDAFFLKREIIANATINVVQAILLVYFGQINIIPGFNFPFILIIAYTFRLPFNVFVPLYMSYKATAWRQASNSGTDSVKESISDSTKIKVSKHYNTLDAVLSEQSMTDLFMTYIKKRFQVQLVLFLEHVKIFKTSEKEAFAGKAILLFQKFIKPGSLLDLNVPAEILDRLQTTINDERKLLEEGLSANFFDDVETFVRQQLEQPFQAFKETDEYKRALSQLHEEAKLNTGLVEMGIVNTE